ncbi:MAG TPA: LURP-one-related family protein [Candidatus Limnocylindrales bacterium]|nr:LURP-one-related family protein [Candidatus Limnocylindrales bacterium]
MFGRRQEAAPANAYKMQQRMFSIGDDYWIETGSGQRAFKVDGKALRIRKTLELQGPGGQTLYTIKEKLVSVRDVMTIEDAQGQVATVKKALISPLRERYNIELRGGVEWKAQGNIVDHQYEISNDSGTIAEVGKKWFAVRDSYGIQVAAGQDDALLIAVVIVIDQMAHPTR